MVDGPFSHYPVTPASISASATRLYDTAQPLDDLGTRIRWAAARAEGHVNGILGGFIQFFGTDLDDRANACRDRAVLASGAVNRWSGAVTTYDTGIDDLNRRYTSASANGFGYEEPIPRGGLSPEAFADEWDDYVADRAAAESELMRQLRGEQQVLHDTLDDEATSVANVLDSGPSEQAFLALFEDGYLPFDVGDLVPGVPFEDTDRFHDESIEQAIEALTESGRIDGEASAFMRLWVERMVEQGMSADEVAEMADAEGVDESTFALLDDADVAYDPQGNMYALLQAAADAPALIVAIQLMNGTRPSTTQWRHDANDFTYDGPAFFNSDIEMMLQQGGALWATPQGTLMGTSGDRPLDLPSSADLLSSRGGTTWGDIFVVNGSYEDPAGYLRDVIERGYLHDNGAADDLEHLLDHEMRHSEQWAEEGYWTFIAKYLAEGTDACENDFEIDAGLEDGGYTCN